MPWAPFAAGQRVTAGALNSFLMVGATVFGADSTSGQTVLSRSAEVVGDAVIWDSPWLDLLGSWSSAAPTQYVCKVAGQWTLTGSIGYNGSTGGTLREAIWYVNGSLQARGRAVGVDSTAIASTALTVQARTITLPLAVGDVVQLVPLQNNGAMPPAGLTLAGGSLRSYMTATFAGPL